MAPATEADAFRKTSRLEPRDILTQAGGSPPPLARPLCPRSRFDSWPSSEQEPGPRHSFARRQEREAQPPLNTGLRLSMKAYRLPCDRRSWSGRQALSLVIAGRGESNNRLHRDCPSCSARPASALGQRRRAQRLPPEACRRHHAVDQADGLASCGIDLSAVNISSRPRRADQPRQQPGDA